MPDFGGAELDAVLSRGGGRKVEMYGDSTMRGLFIAVACMIPPEFVERYEPNWVANNAHKRLGGGSKVLLRGGGEIHYKDGRVDTYKW